MEISVEQIEKAIHQCYEDSSSQEQARQWLTAAQESSEAWNFAWDLLHPLKPAGVQFFGASTLHMKVSRALCQLPSDQYEPFKQKLLEWIINYSSGPRLILDRLCLALSSFIVHTISDYWPHAVDDICSLPNKDCSNISPEARVKISLVILVFLPEEFHTMISDNYQKAKVKHSLIESSSTALAQLKRILENLQNESKEIQLLVIRCLNSWIQFIVCLHDIECFLSPLFKAVTNDDVNEMAQETLANIASHPEASKYPSLLSKFASFTVGLEPVLQKAALDNDIDLCNSMYGVVISLFESQTSLLFNEFYKNSSKREMILKLINMLLKYTESQDPVEEAYSDASLNIWFTIQDEAIASSPEQQDVLLRYLVPIYKSLVDILLVKVCYPAEHVYDSWNAELKNYFRCYRQDIADTFSYCYNILKANMLNILSSNIAVLLQMSQDPPWQQLEACLYAFQSVSINAGCQEEDFLPLYFQNILNIPIKNSKVASTLFDSIGAYSEWLCCHTEHCKTIIPFILRGINTADVAPSATLCLKEVCRECGPSLAEHFESILSAIQVSLEDSVIEMNERVRLVATLGSILSEMPPPRVFSYLNILVIPHIQQLEKLSSEQPNVHMKPKILLSVNVISMLFLTLKLDHVDDMNNVSVSHDTDTSPTFHLMLQILPILVKIGLLWCQDSNILESVCTLLKRSSSSLNPLYEPILPTTLGLILQIHQKYPDQKLIELSKHFLITFGEREKVKQVVNLFLQQLTNTTLERVNQDFRNSTDLVEDFLQMLAMIIKKKKVLFFESSLPVQHLFHLAINALTLPENLTVRAASQFLASFISVSRENTVCVEVVNSSGAGLVERLFRMIGGESTRMMIDYIPDIVLALNQKYFDNLCRWINIINSNDNLPVPTVSKDQKIQYTRNILKERKNRRVLVGILKEYSLLCRGLIGTEYGHQTCR